MKGTFEVSPYLTVHIEDSLTGEVRDLRSVASEWEFPNDAPSFALRTLDDSQHVTNDEFLKTIVTKSGGCNILKICLGSREPTPAVLAALSVALEAQDRYGVYCTVAQRWTELANLFNLLRNN